MKKKIKLLLCGKFTLALALGVGLSLASCSDTDLDANNSGKDGADDMELTQVDKYDALSRLLGALANVDSLPDNWESNSYTVTPTVGTEGDAANPHVRYVIVPNATEADRTYCSYVGTTSTGSARNHEWSVDGIGSIKFEVNDQADLYATMKLNVQQLPTLEEVRFVPASAIGENGLEPAGTYYQFGDVIKQTKNGKETYWVCVRPCTKVGKLRKTHWATFQVGDENFKKINERTYLPTKLCSNQSEGARMVQNLFNVLRLIQKPSRYDAKFNIDKITNKEFTADKVAAISDLWKRDNIWEKVRVYNSGVENHLSFQDFSAENEIDVFYYGYSSVWIGWGDYRIHQLYLTSSEGEDGLYKKVEFFTPWIYANGQRNRDFRELNKYVFNHSEDYDNIYIDDDEVVPDNAYYVVKTMSGAELEGKSGVDLNPAESFTIRGNNGIEDVFTSNHGRSDVPYYLVGDQIKKSVNYDDFLCCVLSNWKDGGGQKLISYFLAVDRKSSKINEPIELQDQETIKRILYQIYRAWDFTKGSQRVPLSFYGLNKDAFASYKEFLETFHTYYLPNYVAYDQYTGKSTKEGMKYVANANDHYIKAKISGTVYQLSYNENAPVGSQYTLSIPTDEENKTDGSDKLKNLMIYAYEEAGSNTDNLSKSNSQTFVIKGADNRQALRQAISEDLKENFGEWNAEK